MWHKGHYKVKEPENYYRSPSWSGADGEEGSGLLDMACRQGWVTAQVPGSLSGDWLQPGGCARNDPESADV